MQPRLYLPHLETNVTAACQNRCIACNHFVPLTAAKPFMLKPAQMELDLLHFSQLVHVGAYGMLGGEPTLHPELHVLIRIAKESEIADKIEVWTNGQRLVSHQMEDFWQSPFDTLVVSRYPGKITDLYMGDLVRKCHDFGKELVIKDETQSPNFTQLLKDRVHDAQGTYDACWFKTFSRVLDNGFFYRCCTSPYIPKLLLGLPEGTDGLKVDADLTLQQLENFLNQKEAMQSCGICAGRNTPYAQPIPWSEIRDPKLWLDRSSGR